MENKVIVIECGYSSNMLEIPYNDKSSVEKGDEVIFKDAEGKEEYGVVRHVNRDSIEPDRILFTSKILRKATANDIQKVEANIERAKDCLEKAKVIIANLALDMSVFRSGYSFDGTKIHFLFTSEDRVDFRDLVKILAKDLKKQIHLRQIGPRDKAKMIGGYGKCGRELCCTSWLKKMESINMEMVREQALESKGSSKLSGSCGKLLCCLKYEVDSYKELRKTLPMIGAVVEVKKLGNGQVIALDILNQKIKVGFEGRESYVLKPEDIVKILKPSRNLAAASAVAPENNENIEE